MALSGAEKEPEVIVVFEVFEDFGVSEASGVAGVHVMPEVWQGYHD